MLELQTHIGIQCSRSEVTEIYNGRMSLKNSNVQQKKVHFSEPIRIANENIYLDLLSDVCKNKM
jgi:hypothetical protein